MRPTDKKKHVTPGFIVAPRAETAPSFEQSYKRRVYFNYDEAVRAAASLTKKKEKPFVPYPCKVSVEVIENFGS